MKPIWQIDSDDVKTLQGRSREFVRFVNDLLVHQANAGRVPISGLQLNLSDLDPDGGVDAAVTLAIPPESDPEGYFAAPTCWQFKASPTGNIKKRKTGKEKGGQEAALRAEIRKPEVAKRVASGYGYRFCIADDMPPSRKTDWESWLFDEAKKIAADAHPPMVLTASNLAAWANRLPGVILPFRPYLERFQSLRQWGNDITAETPHFVPVAAWQAVMDLIRNHADLSKPCTHVVLTIQGEAGVGKTRCVYEALRIASQNHARLVYTRDEVEAGRVAHILANNDRFAIIVADECTVQARVDLERRLQQHCSRIRVIAIDNTLQYKPTGTGEIHLQRLAEAEVEKILEEHFPALPWERRRAFIRLSGGFVRLALDLCRQSHLIPPEGAIGSVLGFFREHYLDHRLPPRDREVVEAIALLPRVGYRADIRQQLELLCQATGLQADRVVQTAVRLKQAPGFIALGERYLYITPQIIAQAAFQSAWARLIGPRPEQFFLEQLPAELIDAFADQLRACGSDEMGRIFAGFFQNWTSRLAGSDLADEVTVRRLVRLVEVEPQTLLPQLRRLIESISIEELRQLHKGYASSGWPARRELVWLADKFLRLPEHFADAERILLRFALAETEAYANNATGVWKKIFRPLLSGTSIPVAERLQLLEQRFQTEDKAQIALCLGALDESLMADGPLVGRPLGPPVEPRNSRRENARFCLTLPFSTIRDAAAGVLLEKKEKK